MSSIFSDMPHSAGSQGKFASKQFR